MIVYGELFYEANKAAFNYSSFDSSIYSHLFSRIAMLSYYIPDIFFMISGFLFCKKMLAIDSAEPDNPYIEVIKNVGLRMARLYPVYISVFLIYWCITPALHCGPVWYVYQDNVDVCDSSWWKVLLMIDNWFNQSCYPMLWFVQVEAQSTLFVSIFFLIYYTHRTTSYGYFAITMIASFVLLMVLSAELPTNL